MCVFIPCFLEVKSWSFKYGITKADGKGKFFISFLSTIHFISHSLYICSKKIKTTVIDILNITVVTYIDVARFWSLSCYRIQETLLKHSETFRTVSHICFVAVIANAHSFTKVYLQKTWIKGASFQFPVIFLLFTSWFLRKAMSRSTFLVPYCKREITPSLNLSRHQVGINSYVIMLRNCKRIALCVYLLHEENFNYNNTIFLFPVSTFKTHIFSFLFFVAFAASCHTWS